MSLTLKTTFHVTSTTFFRRIIEYVLFWSVSVVLLARFFAYGDTIERIDLIYTLLFHLSLWFGVVLNSYFLISNFLATGRYILYLLFLMVLLATMVLIHEVTFSYLADWISPGYFFISYFEWFEIMWFSFGALAVTSLIQFSRSWFRESTLQRQIAELQQLQSDQELRSLQRQVQPHFLFNSLNTIYALVRKKHPESENAILTLSNLLRYTINKSDKNAVLLSDEISYMNEYITLQQLRLNSPEKVHFEVHDDFEKPVHVLPSLFIVFLENAFKYTDWDREDGGIRVNLNVTEHRINLEIWNSTSSESENNQHSSLEVRNGTGISNAQKRLELHYPGKHKLQTKSEQDHYWIKLEIDL